MTNDKATLLIPETIAVKLDKAHFEPGITRVSRGVTKRLEELNIEQETLLDLLMDHIHGQCSCRAIRCHTYIMECIIRNDKVISKHFLSDVIGDNIVIMTTNKARTRTDVRMMTECRVSDVSLCMR